MKRSLSKGVIAGVALFTTLVIIVVVFGSMALIRNVEIKDQLTESQAQIASLNRELESKNSELNTTNSELKNLKEIMQMPIITGRAYIDANSNGFLDPEDQPFQRLEISLLKDGLDAYVNTVTDVNGIYTFHVSPVTISGINVSNTEGWDVKFWFGNFPIAATEQKTYSGPVILLKQK